MYAVDSPTTRAGGPAHRVPPRRSSRLAGARRRRSETLLAWGLSSPALIALAVMLAYPMYRMIVLSFQNMRLRELLTGSTPPWVGLDQYTKVLSDSVFWTVVMHTAAFTVVSVVASVLAGLAVALLMRRVTRGVRLFMIVAMTFVWALPQLVQAQSFRWMIDTNFGVINYLIDKLPGVSFQNHSWFTSPFQGWVVITTLVLWAGIPFLAITLNAGLTQVPKELLEAATVDGATPWQALRNITLPILKPLIVIVTTLSTIWNFGL